MSKSPIFITPEPSSVSSSQTPKTFDFFSSLAQKTEQEHEIAQKEALAKQKIESRKQKTLELESKLHALESADIITEKSWTDLTQCIQIFVDPVKENLINRDNLINRFVKLAPKVKSHAMIIRVFYDFIFNLDGDVLHQSLSQIIRDLPKISEQSLNAKIYFFELLSKPENIKKLDLERCGQITNILSTIGDTRLQEEIDSSLKEHLKNELHKTFPSKNYRLFTYSDTFLVTLMKLSTRSENDNLIKFLLSEITKTEILDILDDYDKSDIFKLCTKFIDDLPETPALEKLKLEKHLQAFLDHHKLDSILSIDKDFEYLKGLNINKEKEIGPEKWKEIFSLIQKSPKKLDFLRSVSSGEEINFFLHKKPSFLDLFKDEIIPVETQLNIGKVYKTGGINKEQYQKFLENLKETLIANGKTEALTEVLDATLNLKSFYTDRKIAVIDPVIYDLLDKSISYPAAFKPQIITYCDGSKAYQESTLTSIVEFLQGFIDVYPIAKTILKTAQLEGFIGILNSPAFLDWREVAGFYNSTIKNIIIGKNDLALNMATAIIHELTHKHMFQNVNKEGVPFKKDNPESQKLFKTALDKLETEQDVLYQCYKDYATLQHMGESIAYFFEKKIFNTFYSKIICKGQDETESGSRLDESGFYQAAVEKYLLPVMHGFDIIFEKLNSIFSGESKATGTVLDYIGGDYGVKSLEAMEFITLESDPKITDIAMELLTLELGPKITHIITDYLGADWQQADLVD